MLSFPSRMEAGQVSLACGEVTDALEFLMG